MSFSSSMRGGRRRKFKAEINVVPYIDVMLVLLIIFMAVPANEAPSVVNLPRAEKSALPPDTYIQISIEPGNKLSIGVHGKVKVAQDEVADRSALLQRLRALHEENPDFPVLIAGDRDSKYDDVIQLISEAKKMGINRVGLATQ
ncbi:MULTISPECIES: biopolymer transporter ExbD [Massilia]|jgi:biopolymer transport protein TolR|uniref:Biopolymer transporter ExbD n=2 Tax=Massilia TaxID=149698 RepID=A0A422QP93_9BURK|nr:MULTISPECIES: biopolymer transporter ExbD [Massilia]MDY0964321.1 biopolymer transporter ExbD [Massilia sp. CFBP9026]MDY0976233.1 biopolymer transporter ExbD [Massilia sp. CFBP9012]RNF31611.1 biopolymer transporter ExbD [Massilia aurea]TXG01544.1 ExbD/TolR family protein [Massilia arenae]